MVLLDHGVARWPEGLQGVDVDNTVDLLMDVTRSDGHAARTTA